jgi:hypothetical protein
MPGSDSVPAGGRAAARAVCLVRIGLQSPHVLQPPAHPFPSSSVSVSIRRAASSMRIPLRVLIRRSSLATLALYSGPSVTRAAYMTCMVIPSSLARAS